MGDWSPWTKWSNCPCYFKSHYSSKRHRIRSCSNPEPAEIFRRTPCNGKKKTEKEVKLCLKFSNPNKKHVSAIEINFPYKNNKQDVCKSWVNQSKKISGELKKSSRKILKNVQIKVEFTTSLELCINWCLQDDFCLEVRSNELSDKRFKCTKSTSYCSFLISKSSSEKLYRITDLRCVFSSHICQLPIFYYDKKTGYCLNYGGHLNYANAVLYCKNLGLHLLKFSDVQEASNLPNYLYESFGNITIWLGIRKLHNMAIKYKWNSFVWNDTDKVDEDNVRILEGNCFVITISKIGNRWSGVSCDEKHDTLCWRPFRGEWNSWGKWEDDSNKVKRSRACNNPKPFKKNYSCIGESIEYRYGMKKIKFSSLSQLTIFGSLFFASFVFWLIYNSICKKYVQHDIELLINEDNMKTTNSFTKSSSSSTELANQLIDP